MPQWFSNKKKRTSKLITLKGKLSIEKVLKYRVIRLHLLIILIRQSTTASRKSRWVLGKYKLTVLKTKIKSPKSNHWWFSQFQRKLKWRKRHTFKQIYSPHQSIIHEQINHSSVQRRKKDNINTWRNCWRNTSIQIRLKSW